MSSAEATAARLRALLTRARHTVAFTGAGISTESGIPDYRSDAGRARRRDRARHSFRAYVGSPEVRAEAWRARAALWRDPPRPNAGHRALVRLERAGRLAGIVTQNVDGLHRDAGSHRVVELHGSTRIVACIGDTPRSGTPDGCGLRLCHTWALERLAEGATDPACPCCGGLLKTTSVSFGQNLWPGTLEAARDLLDGADLVLIIGTSLAVAPAAGLPRAAAHDGADLVIIDPQPTPLDEAATLVIRARAGAVLEAVANDDAPPPASGSAVATAATTTTAGLERT